MVWRKSLKVATEEKYFKRIVWRKIIKSCNWCFSFSLVAKVPQAHLLSDNAIALFFWGNFFTFLLVLSSPPSSDHHHHHLMIIIVIWSPSDNAIAYFFCVNFFTFLILDPIMIFIKFQASSFIKWFQFSTKVALFSCKEGQCLWQCLS